MSTLKEFLKKECPDGVEWKNLGEVCNTITDYVAAGSFKDIAKNVEYVRSPDYAQLVRTTDIKNNFKNDGFVYVNKRAFDYLYRVNLDKESIILPNVGINCGEVYYVTPDLLPYKNNVLGPNAILVRSDSSNNKFLSYIFQLKLFQTQLRKIISTAGQPKFNKTEFKKIYIPVPPIEVQKEIVRILDEFTDKTTKLQELLHRETILRKKQYEYYRGKLLTFGDEVEWKNLDEIVDILDNLRRPVSKDKRTKGNYPYYGANGIQDYVDNYIFDGTFILMGEDGSVINKDNSPVLNWASGKIWVNNHAHVLFNEDIDILRFVFYYLQTIDVSSIVRGTPPKINQQNLRSIKIPVPPLEEQERIVKILDQFDTLCNDITRGLPAEIELRKKQYEYYRDKLLTFKEKKK